ncbi:MAG: RluA family pseudouridine synthase, partial [Clostridia bacterium]|nr:RluA family pseudouridine synthase [Clostridia bacterium]
MNFRISPCEAGSTVKDYLRSHGVSATCLRQLKQTENGITLNGVHCTVRAVLAADDVLSIAVEDRAATVCAPSATSLSVPVLYEDADILVVEKPWGMPTHQSHGHRGDTLSDAVLSMKNAPTVFRAINRLDADTSGIVLLARNRLAANVLCARMASGEIQKEYLAIVEKTPDPPSGKMVDYIAREGESIIRRVTVAEGEGDYAETDYE